MPKNKQIEFIKPLLSALEALALATGPRGFSNARMHVKMSGHDVSSDEIITRQLNATRELAIVVGPTGEQAASIEFELLCTFPW